MTYTQGVWPADKASKLVVSFWHGRPLSLLERAAISSYLRHGYDYAICSYEPLANLPTGAVNIDARKIWNLDPSTIRPHEALKSYGPFADLFRYRLLRQLAGVTVVDVDQFCLRPFPGDPYLFGFQSTGVAAMGVMRLPAKSDLMAHISQLARQFRDTYDQVMWGQTGPKLFTHAIHLAGVSHLILSSLAFYPIAPSFKMLPFLAESSRWQVADFLKEPRTFGLQLWTSGVRWTCHHAKFDLDFDRPVPGSFYEKLVAHYLM